ncbi:sensor histidine kinase [Longispora albida]|uniref:sensor histidine kinase n=1 Tax=Longispora albida TaxID=203523 RepID=UPI00035ED414|nr:histidine kinase [Longispora albida]
MTQARSLRAALGHALAALAPVIVWNSVALGASVPPARVFLAALLAVPAYLAGRWLPALAPLWLAGLAGAVSVPVWTREPWSVADGLIGLAVTLLCPWAIGRYRRQNAALLAAAVQRAEQARLLERHRIASDMHDSLGHGLSLVALQAGALELAPDLPGRHREAVTALRVNAVSATEQLREILGLMREEEQRAPLVPAGEPVRDLVARAQSSGVPVTLSPPDATTTDRTVYRVVQEAITNAVKHAPGAPITVQLAAGGVTVRNGRPRAAASGAGGPGQGLAGLAERVRLAGGTFRAGPLPDGGFEVAAEFQVAAIS